MSWWARHRHQLLDLGPELALIIIDKCYTTSGGCGGLRANLLIAARLVSERRNELVLRQVVARRRRVASMIGQLDQLLVVVACWRVYLASIRSLLSAQVAPGGRQQQVARLAVQLLEAFWIQYDCNHLVRLVDCGFAQGGLKLITTPIA